MIRSDSRVSSFKSTATAIAALFAGLASLTGACTSSSSSSGGVSGYCSAANAYVTRCNVTDACAKASVAECSTVGAAYAPAALDALVACIQNDPCGDAGEAQADQCITGVFAKLTPSSAQVKVAQDFCASACTGEPAATCVASFFGNDGGPGGYGVYLLEYNDAIAQAVDAKCIPASDAGVDCVSSFFQCLFTQVELAAPEPAACQSTGGVGGQDGG
jgi:hypothetical protein